MYLDVKSYVAQWKEELRQRVKKQKGITKLDIVMIGDNEASLRYVRNKIKDCKEVGIVPNLISADSMTPWTLQNVLENCDGDGVMVQLPVEKELEEVIYNYLPYEKDADGFINPDITPATAFGIIKYLEEGLGVNLEGKDVLVIGRSEIVGKPLAQKFTEKNATVTLAHSKTRNLREKYAGKQIIVSATGKPGIVDANLCPAGCIVVDVGINTVDGKIVGDAKPTALVGDVINGEESKARVTPVPGGVGLLTRCALLDNVLTLKERQR